MGYEGTEIYMCSNNHYELYDATQCMYEGDDDFKCDHCNEPMHRVGSRDETNGAPYYLDFELHQKTPLIRHHCPVCGKVHETTEETYEFKEVKQYESEDGDFIRNKIDPIDRVMCQPCSDLCKRYLAMSEFIESLLKKEPKHTAEVECAFLRHGVNYQCPEMFLYRYKKPYKKTFDMSEVNRGDD